MSDFVLDASALLVLLQQESGAERVAQLLPRSMVSAVNTQLAYAAGELRSATSKHGLSLGNRACLALAHRHDIPAVTTDRAWKKAAIYGIQVEQVR